ncbi:MAG: branched-chain amino acid ABC transporter permease [Candidatus Nephthysia bennettiae]|uniref:Branched-chain amino acid ABC transporter permease n=1 Tax=Candidatus Nephthysia bennettiae TaxID=3127016 RepID=A0A934NDA9_9BACT|nr:branched-chain amino acid ABC transporter permease [Candidatus Dormibacteraeota bacterium]MBJ7613526.1 branched-chain amino acid ABC transporter permease [Candidatus Dormibacteraeota bacterium]PZR87816.1 MAG: branched-chain amino acid ABC transporter permease [Candidatus Dormibacteraeota bacterium]
MAIFIQYTVNGLTAGAFYALVALGYTIIYGIIRLINFAHGDLTMVGAFIGWTALVSLGLQRLPVILAIALAAVISMGVTSIINVGILRFAYKPLLNRSLLAILITALGMSIFLQNAALLVFGAGVQAYPHLVTSSGVFIGGVRISFAQSIFFSISLLLMAGLYVFARFTTLGTAMRALAVDHDAARLMGINVDRVIAIAFILAAILAAAAGVMIGLYYTQINFFLGFILGLRAFTSAVLGGIGNIPGAMAGGLLIGLLESYCAGYLSGRWQDVFVFGVLIAVLIIKPTGLFGERVAERM